MISERKMKLIIELRKTLTIIMKEINLRVLNTSIKDIYLFNEKEDESAHEGIRYLFNEEDEFVHESPFKSIIADIKNNLTKRGHKFIKNTFKYAEEKGFHTHK